MQRWRLRGQTFGINCIWLVHIIQVSCNKLQVLGRQKFGPRGSPALGDAQGAVAKKSWACHWEFQLVFVGALSGNLVDSAMHVYICMLNMIFFMHKAPWNLKFLVSDHWKPYAKSARGCSKYWQEMLNKGDSSSWWQECRSTEFSDLLGLQEWRVGKVG